MSVADSAVGAILEIPPQALDNIQKAENAIRKLAAVSADAAGNVNLHWGEVATNGLQKFIDKLAEAKNAMNGLGTINVTLNTQTAVQNAEQLSNATQKTSTDVSKAVQDMAMSYDSLAKVDISKVANIAREESMQIDDIKAKIKELKAEIDIAQMSISGKNDKLIDNPNLQRIVDEKKAWEELLRIRTEATGIKDKALSAAVAKQDKAYLDEQKTLLQQILQYQKDINAESTRQERVTKLGGTIPQEDINKLERYKVKLQELTDSYTTLKGKIDEISTAGQKRFNKADVDYELAKARELTTADEKRGQALQMVSKYLSETKLKAAGISSREEGVYMNEQVAVYQQMIAMIKKRGEVEAQVASQGYAQTSAQTNLLQTIQAEYNRLEASLSKVTGKYTEIDRVVANAFGNAKTMQEAENAAKLSESYQKAAEAAQKVADAQAKAAQQQADKDRSQAESELNRLYSERLRLLKEQEQLNNKALINTAKGLPDLTAKENQLLAEVTARIDAIDGQIKKIGKTYAGLAAKTKHAFALDELRQATALQNQFNKALESVDTSNTKKLVAEYKKLYAENQRLQASMDKVDWSSIGFGSIGSQAYQNMSDAYNRMQAQVQANQQRMADIERNNIQEIANFRQQKDMETNQRSISEFIQAEAQKKAEALKTIQETNTKRQEAWQRYLQSYEGAMKQANALSNGNRSGGYTDTYENRARVIKNLESAIKSLNKSDADYEKKLKDLTDALVHLKEAQKGVNNALKQKPKVGIFEANRAKQIAEQTKTLKDYETAYQLLIEAMKTTPQGNVWDAMNANAKKMKQNIDEIKKKMGEFHKQTSSTSNVMGQLQGRIAAAFSVGAITGFVKKVTEVRAQFELQRVALGAIIQDRDEANKIFTQVQNMALESPFNIMQLEKATKQIAAFGFETKKLVPTMKMFADISAGLGVEIDRLVLVMGHLKARNFLEGTMVRQFTNMGFNVLGELSKYYQELEGKMVSVAEVQDRVKKKMVSFADVEEVLKRVTSAGGMFYDMQKKQSDSIWGQMQRIQDAYDLMLNEIGQSNEGVIKGTLTLIRNLINSWRILVPLIKSVGASIVMYFAISRWSAISTAVGGVVTMFKNMRTAVWGAKTAQDALNASQKASGWGLLISLIAAATVAVYEFATAQSKLNESMDRVRADGIANMYDLIVQYKKLADTVKDTTKTYEERKEAMDEMNRVFKDILPDQMLEIDNIRQMKNGYEEATEAIRAYSAEKIKANLKSEIENIVSKDIVDATGDISDMMTTLLNNWKKLPADMKPQTFRSMAQTIITEFTEEVKNGSIPIEKAVDELKKRIANRLEGIVPKESIYKAFTKLPKLDDGLEDWYDSLQKYVDAVKGIDLGIESPLQRFAQPEIDKYEALEKAVSDYINALKNLREEQKKGGINGVKMTENGGIIDTSDTEMGYEALQTFLEKKNEMMSAISQYGINYKITADDINNAIQSNVDMLEYEGNVQYDIFTKILNNFSNWGAALKNNNYFLNWLEKIGNKVEGIKFTGIRKEIADTQRDIVKKFGLTEAVFDKFKWDGMTSYSDVQKQAKQLTDEAKKQIKEITAVRMEMLLLGHSAAEAQQIAESRVGISEKEAKEKQNAYEAMWKAFGGSEKEKKSKKSSDAELKRWQDLKKAIESVRTAYEKARKSFTVDESNKMIEERWGDVFKALGSNIKDFYKNGVYDMDALIKAYDVLIEKAKKAATTEDRKKFLSELIASQKDTEIELKVKLQEESEKKLKADIDEMFANYELSEELKKIGVSVDLTYMVGGKPMTLDDIRKEIERLRAEGGDKADAENRIKILEDAEKKITQMELKNQKERLKNYVKYLTESMGERAQIEIKAIQDINKIEEDATLDSFSKQQAIMQRRKKMNEELTKFDLDQLKSSDVYLSVFKDLEDASKEQLQYVIDKLKEMQTAFSDLSPAQVKSIASDIKKMEDAIASQDSTKNLFKNLRDSIKYAQKRKELLKEQTNLQKELDSNRKAESAAQEYLYELELKRKSIQDESSEEWQEANEKVIQQQKLVEALQNKIKELEEKLKGVSGEIDKGEHALKGFTEGLGKIHQKMNQIKESLDAVFEGLDSMGLVNDAFRDTYESITEIIGGIDTFMSGLEQMDFTKPFTIVTGSIKAIGGIFQTIGGFFGIGDKKKEREIQRLVENVDTLDKAYQRLEKSIEDAYAFSDYNAGYKQMQDNLEQQKNYYNEMVRLEEAKKKTDDEKIKEYKEKLEEIADAEDELRQSRHEMYGSTNDVWSEANNWVDAWLDAYKETGDGLDALNDSWDEFYENLVKKQATSAIVGSRMKDYIDRINAVIDSNMDEYGYVDAFKEIGEAFKADSAEWNKLLKEFFEYAGIKGGSGDFILSDLQKGIQNITEPQAAAIEAYLNSMRFAVFRHTEQLDILIATIQMQYGSGAENPVVTELKGIRSVLDRIDSRLSSVINTRGANPALRITGN